ncbi:MAG: O-antigen ligase family protein [Elusimicrobia bacterium]|nr:O-antigen ligase family protein [Elusimicrobiota bacterium]
MTSFSVSIMEIGCGLALLSLVLSMGDREKRSSVLETIKNDPLLLPWLVFLAAGLFSCLFGVSPARSASFWFSDLLKACFYCTLLCVLRAQSRGHARNWYLLGAAAAAGYGIWQSAAHLALGEGWVRAHGTMNSITFAETLVLSLCLAMDGISRATSRIGKWIYACAACLIFLAVLLSGARGPLLGFMAAFAAALVFSKRKMPFITAAFAGMFLLAGAYKFNDSFRARFDGVAMAGRVASGATSTDSRFDYAYAFAGDRAELWRTGWQIARDYPLFGVGIANIKQMFSYYHPAPMPDDRGAKTVFNYSNVHNLYLQQLAERGTLGLFALLFLLFSMTAVAWREYRQTGSLWLLCAVTAFFFINISETSFQHAVVAGAFILPFALREDGGGKLRLRWPLMLSAALVSAALLFLLIIRPAEKSRPLDFDGPFFFWDQPAPAFVNDLSRRAPPIVVQGAVGEFRFENNGANGLRLISLKPGINDRRELQIGYCAGANSFPMALAPGNAVVLDAETVFSGKGKAWLFIQDERGGWQRDSVAVSAKGRSRSSVSRVIREGAKNVCLGVYWTPSADNEHLELLDVLISEKAAVLSGSVPSAKP